MIGIEACATTHYWAREISAVGHNVKLMPPHYVKPYVKRQKNDMTDAAAICEAVTRPSMRFVPFKSEEQQAVLMLYRSRELLVRQHTMLLNALRALGLNPSVYQSGEGPAQHGRITKQGRSHARSMLVEAAWAAARSPSPLRAFFRRIAARRGQHIAVVANSRKLATITWQMLTRNEDYIWARPGLMARKFRSVELRAGLPAEHARRGIAYDYNIPEKRAAERRNNEAAEADYATLTSNWRTRSKSRSTKAVENGT